MQWFGIGTHRRKWLAVLLVLLMVSSSGISPAEDAPQWGRKHTRNMISQEVGLPDSFDPGKWDPRNDRVDPTTTRNVRWTASLGQVAYGSPVVAEGRVLVGTNEARSDDPQLKGDRGVLMCFAEDDGEFLWELVVPKMYEIKFSDWHRVGISSTPVVEDGRVYLTTNRCEVVCLDLAGMADGNQGPYEAEAAHMANPGDPPVKPTDRHADILWLTDMVAEVGAKPHNAANCSVLIDGDLIYVCTGNGVDWTHSRVMNPEAPTLIVLDKKTGKVLARDRFGIGPNIIHGQWSSPSMGVIDGKKYVFQGTGSGYLFAVGALTSEQAKKARTQEIILDLQTVWKFNGHPKAQLQEVVPLEHFHDTHSYEVVANPVVLDDRIYVMFTQELYHKMPLGWLACLDAKGEGETTRTGGLIWGYDDVSSSGSTVSIADGLLYIADGDGRLHCLDAETGQPYWVHEVGGPIWGSTLVADGKVYLGTGRRGFWIFRHGPRKEILHECTMPDKILSTPTAANGTLYVTVFKTLYAIAEENSE